MFFRSIIIRHKTLNQFWGGSFGRVFQWLAAWLREKQVIGLDVLRDFNQLLPDQFPAQVLKQQAAGILGALGKETIGQGRVAMTWMNWYILLDVFPKTLWIVFLITISISSAHLGQKGGICGIPGIHGDERDPPYSGGTHPKPRILPGRHFRNVDIQTRHRT